MTLRSRLTAIRSSFQFKLFSLFTLLTAVITILFVTVFVLDRIHEDRRHAREKLRLLSKGLADSIRLPLYAENNEALFRYAEEAARLPQVRSVEFLSVGDRVLVKIPKAPGDLSQCITETAEVRSFPLSFLSDAALEKNDDAHGSLIGRVRLYRGTEDLTQTARRLTTMACTLALLFWLLVSGSCYCLLRRVTSSFQALLRGVQNIQAGDYASRIEVTSDDEPGRAALSVNRLAETLAQREAENRRLHSELVEAIGLEIASRERVVAINQSLETEMEKRSQVKQELRNLVEQLPVGIVWSEADGRIENLNRFMVERIGYDLGQVTTVGAWWQLACPDPAQRERVEKLRQKAIEAWKNGEVFFYDVQVACKDGTLRELNCSNQLSGRRTVDIMIDMTERELLQRQIVRNQKLESIGILAGGIAHNFNNALTGVLGYISFAKKFVEESDRLYALLAGAEKATNRASSLANQLLTFANGGAPVRKAVSVAELVDESVALATCGSKVTGRVELPPSLPFVHVDDRQISQAFNCICINAVQAMPDGGVLTVRGREVVGGRDGIPVSEPGEYVELCFEDQGCGIKDEDKANIFIPYFTTKAEVGTGLGLATVHSIVTRHGGAITFATMVGKGTTFTLYLPMARGAALGEAAAVAARA